MYLERLVDVLVDEESDEAVDVFIEVLLDGFDDLFSIVAVRGARLVAVAVAVVRRFLEVVGASCLAAVVVCGGGTEAPFFLNTFMKLYSSTVGLRVRVSFLVDWSGCGCCLISLFCLSFKSFIIE